MREHPSPGPGADIREYSVDQLLDARNRAGSPDQIDRELARRATGEDED